jgi:hypothetical protein
MQKIAARWSIAIGLSLLLAVQLQADDVVSLALLGDYGMDVFLFGSIAVVLVEWLAMLRLYKEKKVLVVLWWSFAMNLASTLFGCCTLPFLAINIDRINRLLFSDSLKKVNEQIGDTWGPNPVQQILPIAFAFVIGYFSSSLIEAWVLVKLKGWLDETPFAKTLRESFFINAFSYLMLITVYSVGILLILRVAP